MRIRKEPRVKAKTILMWALKSISRNYYKETKKEANKLKIGSHGH